MPNHDDDLDDEFAGEPPNQGIEPVIETVFVDSPPTAPTVDIRVGLAFLLFIAVMAFFCGYMTGETNGRSTIYEEKRQEAKEDAERKAISEIRQEIRDLRHEVKMSQ